MSLTQLIFFNPLERL